MAPTPIQEAPLSAPIRNQSGLYNLHTKMKSITPVSHFHAVTQLFTVTRGFVPDIHLPQNSQH